MKEIKTEKIEASDPISMVMNTPTDRLPQLTIIPTGGVNFYAQSKTIQQMGKPNAYNGLTPMEYYMNTMFQYSRSKGGALLAGAMKLALAKVETSAAEEQEKKMYIDNG